eukprot:CFRG8424T1
MSLSAKEIETFRLNLQQVEIALQADPENSELLNLQANLHQLLDLAGAETHTTQDGDVQDNIVFNVGDVIESTPSVSDGQWYPSKVDKVLQTAQGTRYSLTYVEDTSISMVVDASQVRTAKNVPTGETADKTESQTPYKTKRQLEEDSREYKKAKREKKKERLRKLEEDSEKDKSNWQAFATGKVKKGKKSRAPNIMNKKSMFATNESGKVGVIGSGKPLTEFHQRGKHVHEKSA